MNLQQAGPTRRIKDQPKAEKPDQNLFKTQALMSRQPSGALRPASSTNPAPVQLPFTTQNSQEIQNKNTKPASHSQPPLPSKTLQTQAQSLKPKVQVTGIPKATSGSSNAEQKLQSSKPAASLPPIPGKDLQQKAQNLKPAQPPLPTKALQTQAQSLKPSIPTKTLQSQAQNLKPSAPSQPPLPSKALQNEAQNLKPSSDRANSLAPNIGVSVISSAQKSPETPTTLGQPQNLPSLQQSTQGQKSYPLH